MKREINFGVCAGRHEIVTNDGNLVKNYVFDKIVNPTDVVGLEAHARKYFKEYFETNGRPFSDVNVYVTGLTVATIAIVNVLLELKEVVCLWHYDRESEKYFSQKIYKCC